MVFYVSGRLWEAQSVVFYVFGRVWEAQSDVFYVSGRLWEAQSVVFYTLRAGPPTQLSFVLLPRASYLEISFCAPFGALRLSARLIGGGWSYSESMILSRIDYLIPHYIRDPGGEGRGRRDEG